MDAIQLRFMALVLRLLIATVTSSGFWKNETVLHQANDMIILLDDMSSDNPLVTSYKAK